MARNPKLHGAPKNATVNTSKLVAGAHADGQRESTIQEAVWRIDETHTAPKAAWLAMEMPQWPTVEQNRAIIEASIMRRSKVPIVRLNGLNWPWMAQYAEQSVAGLG